MTDGVVVALGREALWTVLLVSAPVLGLGLLVGLCISLFQATTQIQEQTLTFVPKIIAALIAIMLTGPWMLQKLTQYAANLLGNLHHYVR
jgi:flagellar biosynthetic protein FliQ